MCWCNPSKGTRMINELPTAFPWMHKDITCTGMTLREDIQGRYEFMGEGASECAGAIRARGQE